jgi:hypothetical protein
MLNSRAASTWWAGAAAAVHTMAGRAAIMSPARKMSVGWSKNLEKRRPAWTSADKGADLGRTSAEETLCASAKKIRGGDRIGRGAGEFREITARIYCRMSRAQRCGRNAGKRGAKAGSKLSGDLS